MIELLSSIKQVEILVDLTGQKQKLTFSLSFDFFRCLGWAFVAAATAATTRPPWAASVAMSVKGIR